MAEYRWEELLEQGEGPALMRDLWSVFPCNPADSGEALKMLESMALALLYNTEEPDEKHRIRIRHQGIHPGYNLPLVTVEGPEGARLMRDYSLEELIRMRIEADLSKSWTPGRILALLILNRRYPLRVERQKKRDAVAEWLRILRLRNEEVPEPSP